MAPCTYFCQDKSKQDADGVTEFANKNARNKEDLAIAPGEGFGDYKEFHSEFLPVRTIKTLKEGLNALLMRSYIMNREIDQKNHSYWSRRKNGSNGSAKYFTDIGFDVTGYDSENTGFR